MIQLYWMWNSGISAANQFIQDNRSTIMIETNSYIGGRIKAHVFPEKIIVNPQTNKPIKLDLKIVAQGAAFLTGNEDVNPLWEICTKNKIKSSTEAGGGST